MFPSHDQTAKYLHRKDSLNTDTAKIFKDTGWFYSWGSYGEIEAEKTYTPHQLYVVFCQLNSKPILEPG